MVDSRRSLLKVLSGLAGGGALVGVASPMVRAALDSVGRTTVSGAEGFVRVAALKGVPEDGTPVSVPVVVEAPVDAWARMPATEVGTVWLMRKGDEVLAFSNVCPHLGCAIDWQGSAERFVCPCHDSFFAPDGSALTGPSPRGMDPLECRVVRGEVEVRYATFQLGTKERRPA